nr:SH3 domain-containing protein [Paracoccus litorisediminis]
MARRPSSSHDVDEKSTEDATSENESNILSALDEQTDDDEAQIDELEALAETPSEINYVYIVNARDGLNLRSGPATDFSIIRSLPLGTRVQVLQREGRWGLVDQQGDGAADGFVHLSFLIRAADGQNRWGATIAEREVRAFWAERNPRGAKLYNNAGAPLVDPQLLHASALGAVTFEDVKPNLRIELYGPGGGFRKSGSTGNHGAQPGTGRGAAMDFVIIDRRTGNMLTNHPGTQHQHQGTVGKNAPSYQIYFNAVVRSGSQLYPRFAEMARFGGYFKSGSNAMDTMHIDMRGMYVPMAGGSLKGGFTREQIRKWNIPENHPYA